MKRMISIPASLRMAAKVEKLDPAELVEWILQSLDTSLVYESAAFLRSFINREKLPE